MRDRYLEVNFRKGKPLAAYLYLPRQSGAKSARTEEAGEGLLIDYSAEGGAIGLEITAPGRVTLEEINRVLERIGAGRIGPEEMAPVAA